MEKGNNIKKKNNIRRRPTPKDYLIEGITWTLIGSMVGIMGTAAYYTKKDSKPVGVNQVESECKVPCQHLHCYINSNGFITYLASEEAMVGDFVKLNKVKPIFSDSDIELANKLYENGLVLVEDNRDLITYIENSVSYQRIYNENGEAISKVPGFYGYYYDSETDTFVQSGYTASIFNISEDYPYVKMESLYIPVDVEELDEDFESIFGWGMDDSSEEFFDTESSEEEQEEQEEIEETEDPDAWFTEGEESNKNIVALSNKKTSKQKKIGVRKC